MEEENKKEELSGIINYKVSWFIRWGLFLLLIFMIVFSIIVLASGRILSLEMPAKVVSVNNETICLEFQDDTNMLVQNLRLHNIYGIRLSCSGKTVNLRFLNESDTNCFIVIDKADVEYLKPYAGMSVRTEMDTSIKLIFVGL